jgi:HEAT repeat protein
MNHTLTVLIAALAMSGTAVAQAPATPNSPPAASKANKAGKPNAAAKASTNQDNIDDDDREPNDDEELALAALEGLMAQPGDRALPIVKKVLAGSQSKLVKKRALFVLSQIHAPEARQLLAQTAQSTDPAMRREAIRSIGISGDPQLLDSLQSTYDAGDAQAKHEVLQAWLIAGRKEAVYKAALNAKSEDEASDAIRILGAMGATEELRKLGERPNAPRGLVDAYAISGDLASLRKIAEGAGERGMRIDAVRKIGIIHDDAARAALRDIYSKTDDPEIREAALQGMLIGGDEQGVLALYRAAKSSDEKRKLLRTLSMIDGDAALQAIDAALEDKK